MKMGKDFNASVEVLFNKVDDLVSTKTVVGEAIVIGDITLLPLIEVAVGVGAGAKEDSNAAGGMGAKITPSAVLVIHAGGAFCGFVTVIADERAGTAVKNDGQSVMVEFVGDLVHDRVLDEAVVTGGIADHIDLFFGEIFADNVLKTDLTSDGITIGLGMAGDDDPVVCLDLVYDIVKHRCSSCDDLSSYA